MQHLRTPNYKETPIETAFINMSHCLNKTPIATSLQRPKSFSNLRKNSCDYSSSNKNNCNMSNINHYQTTAKHSNQSKLLENHQNSLILLKHLKKMNNKSMNFEIIPATNPTKNCNNTNINKSFSKSQKSKPSNNKKFIDLYKRGGSITNVQVNVNVNSQGKQPSLNSSNNISTTSISNLKGKSTHYTDSSHNQISKEHENQILILIKELKNSQKTHNDHNIFPDIIEKTFNFLKKLPGNDTLLITLFSHFYDFLYTYDKNCKEKRKELDEIRKKERETLLNKQKELESELDDYRKKQEDFLIIFEILKSKGINLEEAVKSGIYNNNNKNNSSYEEETSYNLQKKQKKHSFLLKESQNEEFADESLINDSEESSFNYFGKPESPPTSYRSKALCTRNNENVKKTKFSQALKLNLKAISKKNEESSSEEYSEKTINNNNNKENNHFKKKF